MTDIINALDIGTDSIKMISCSMAPSPSPLKLLAFNSVPSFGMRKGVVVDTKKVSSYIKEAVDKQSQILKRRIKNVYINLNGHHIFIIPSRGTVAISRADQIVSQKDIDRVIEAAKAISIPSNKEIIASPIKDFIVDGEKVDNPLGMKGTRLEVDILAICCFIPYWDSLSEAVLDAGLQVSDTFISPLAAARAVLSPRQKELGVALLDIGSSTTGLVIYKEGKLLDLAVFPIGSFNITKDITIGLKTKVEIAEEIKKKFGLRFLTKIKLNKKEKLQISKEDSSLTKFTPKEIRTILEPRLNEFFGLINKEIKKAGCQKQLPAGVVLTGGGAKLIGLKEVAKVKLKLPVSIGFSKGIVGLPKDTSWSTVAGLALLGSEDEEESSPNIKGKLANFLGKIFKVFIP